MYTQGLFSYCCLAILKSYYAGLRGILSYSFYDSMDGTTTIGIRVWDSVKSATFLEKNPTPIRRYPSRKIWEPRRSNTTFVRSSMSAARLPASRIPSHAFEYNNLIPVAPRLVGDICDMQNATHKNFWRNLKDES